MSNSPNSTAPSRVVFVGTGTEPMVRSAASALIEEGIQVIRVADVYAAMADLALNPKTICTLLDVRPMDRAELRFISLGPRYFPGLHVAVLSFEGTQQRASDLPGDAVFIEPGEILEAVLSYVGPQPEVLVPQEIVPPSHPLSTDGGIEAAAASGESLHEAVRMRMAGADSATIRRKPPSKTPPVSREEFDALLAGEHEPDIAKREGSAE